MITSPTDDCDADETEVGWWNPYGPAYVIVTPVDDYPQLRSVYVAQDLALDYCGSCGQLRPHRTELEGCVAGYGAHGVVVAIPQE